MHFSFRRWAHARSKRIVWFVAPRKICHPIEAWRGRGPGGPTCTERLELPQPREWSSWLGLRFVEHVFVGHYYGLRVRIVDPYINMARLGSMQRDGHSPLLAPFVLSWLEFPKSHVRLIENKEGLSLLAKLSVLNLHAWAWSLINLSLIVHER